MKPPPPAANAPAPRPDPVVRTADAADGLITPVCSIFRRFLKRQNLRFTTERAMILEAVMSKADVFEADELYAEMRSAVPGGRSAAASASDRATTVSRATIYRTLKHLLEAGIIREVLIDSGKAHYALSFGGRPTGHLVCVETDRIVAFPTERLDALMREVCAEHGFTPVSHRLVVYGVSPEASATDGADGPS